MSNLSHLSAYSGLNVTDYYKLERPGYVREFRSFGKINMLDLGQPAGSYPDPKSGDFVMLVPLQCDCRVKFDFGAGKIENNFVSELSLATPGVVCEYELDSEHHVIGLSFSASVVSDLLGELDPRFPGHFGRLHSTLWRDNSVRDHALTVWRAAKGDPNAPQLDGDTALMMMATLLHRRARTNFSPKDFSYRLSPKVRRRVIDFIESHLDEDLPLFRLAEIAQLSPFHFARAFRNDMGDPPHRFVLRSRLRRAEHLIKSSDLSLAGVAMSAGFGSQPRMNEVFARENGVTPGQIRRAARS